MSINQRYDPTPVIGYSEGLIIVSDGSRPVRITERNNPNDWFYIGLKRYNVHPFRSDLGGYPVRWSETVSEQDVMPIPTGR